MNYQIILFGSPGSGKSYVIDKTLKYLNLEKPDIYKIDEYIKKDKNYHSDMMNILSSIFPKNISKEKIGEYIKNNKSISKKINDIYYIHRKKIEKKMNDEIKQSCKNNKNILIETIGLKFPYNLKNINKNTDLYLVFTFKKFEKLVSGNFERSINKIQSFVNSNFTTEPPRIYLSSNEQLKFINTKLVILFIDLILDYMKNNSFEITKGDFSGIKFRIIVFNSEDYSLIFDSNNIPTDNTKYKYLYNISQKIINNIL